MSKEAQHAVGAMPKANRVSAYHWLGMQNAEDILLFLDDVELAIQPRTGELVIDLWDVDCLQRVLPGYWIVKESGRGVRVYKPADFEAAYLVVR